MLENDIVNSGGSRTFIKSARSWRTAPQLTTATSRLLTFFMTVKKPSSVQVVQADPSLLVFNLRAFCYNMSTLLDLSLRADATLLFSLILCLQLRGWRETDYFRVYTLSKLKLGIYLSNSGSRASTLSFSTVRGTGESLAIWRPILLRKMWLLNRLLRDHSFSWCCQYTQSDKGVRYMNLQSDFPRKPWFFWCCYWQGNIVNDQQN